MAAALQDKLGSQPKLIKGSNGIFDVHLDGKLVFSKDQQGRFPEHEEVFGLVGKNE